MAIVLCLPVQVQAAGPWALERGVSNFARGGANFVAPTDPIAVYSNPAGLVGLPGLQFMLDANMTMDNRKFKRAPDDLNNDGTQTEYDTVGGSPTPTPSPGFFMSYNFEGLGLKGFAMGAGLYGPVANNRSWPEDGPQRYSEIVSRNLQVHYSLAAAYELPFWKIRVGATGMLVKQDVRTRVALHLPILTAVPEDHEADITVNLRAHDGPLPTAVFALSMQPLDWLAFSGSYQLGWDIRANGKLKNLELGGLVEANGVIEGDEVGVRTRLPSIARAAVRYIGPENRFDVEFAFVWEEWSVYDEVKLNPRQVFFRSDFFGDFEIPQLTFKNNFRDTYSLRLGGSWVALDDLLLVRAGAFYERAAVDEKTLSPSSFERDRLGITVGGRVDLPAGIWIDVAAGFVHWFSGRATDSEVVLVDPLEEPTSPDRELHPIANGTYENWLIMVMASVGIELDL